MILTTDFATDIEQAEIQFFNSKLTAIQNIPNNPMGVEIGNFGSTMAFCAMQIPGPAFNVVKGLRGENITDIAPIVQLYRDKKIPITIEVSPTHATTELLKALQEQGMTHSSFHTTLYGEIQNVSNNVNNQSRIVLRTLEKNEFDLFAKIYVEGFQMPPFLIDGVAQNNQVLYDQPGWSFYVASIDEKPVGIATLFINNNFAILAAATVLPSYRNMGIHQLLIQHRIEQAAKKGCTIVIGHAKYTSISQNNMERFGLKIAYTKSIWTEIK